MKKLNSGWGVGLLQLVFVTGVLALALLIVSALGASQDSRSPVTADITEHGAIELSVLRPEQRPYTPVLRLNGVVQTQLETSIAPQVGGRVIYVAPQFRTGGKIAKSTVLFRIDPADFVLNVESANAEIAAAKSSLAQLEAEAALAIDEWTALYPGESIPDLAARKPQIAAARARLQSAEAARSRAALSLERTVVKAEADLRVLSTQLSAGQILAPNQVVGRAYPVSGIEIAVPVSQSQLTVLAPVIGRAAAISGTTNQLAERSGDVVRSDASLDSRTRLVNLYILPSTHEGLSVGEFVSVSIEGNNVSDAMFIPKSALSRKGEVWVVVDGRLSPRGVTQIGETETHLVVRQFHAADGLVIVPPGDAYEGMEVVIRTGDNA